MVFPSIHSYPFQYCIICCTNFLQLFVRVLSVQKKHITIIIKHLSSMITINALPQDLTNKNEKKKRKSLTTSSTSWVYCTILTLYLLPFHNYQNPHYHHDPGSIKKKIPKLNIKFIFLIWKAYAYINSYYKNSELYKIRYSNITIWILF